MTRVLSRRWLVAVGRWSYGIYLWHLPVVVLLDPQVPRSGPGGWLLLTACTLLIAVPLGAATFAWVEQPAIRWSKRTREEREASRREGAEHDPGERTPEGPDGPGSRDTPDTPDTREPSGSTASQ